MVKNTIICAENEPVVAKHLSAPDKHFLGTFCEGSTHLASGEIQKEERKAWLGPHSWQSPRKEGRGQAMQVEQIWGGF